MRYSSVIRCLTQGDFGAVLCQRIDPYLLDKVQTNVLIELYIEIYILIANESIMK